MKINVKEITLEQLEKIEPYKHKKPFKRSFLLALVIRIASMFTLTNVKFKSKLINMDKLDKKEPCLIIMNHSSFIDLKIASKLLFPRKYNIICSDDGFVGKEFLMRFLGCVPTKKYLTDATLVRDIMYCVKELKSSVLMYPEACYSMDGKTTILPSSVGKCIKLLKIPVVMITTYGAYHRDPLYNNLQLRKVNVSATMEYIISKEDIKEKTSEELMDIVNKYFSFDNYKWQQENKIRVKENFRADYLNRVLYKCPHCLEENMEGKGISLTCKNCANEYILDEHGYLKNTKNETIFDSVPKWYKWERECVKKEIEEDKYLLDEIVDIYALKDFKCIYKLSKGRLVHNKNGFSLYIDNKLIYSQPANHSYTLNSDLNWYEIGDVIGIGDNDVRYYCVINKEKDVALKARLATEELFKKNSL